MHISPRRPALAGLILASIFALALAPQVAGAQATSPQLELPPSKPGKWRRIGLSWAGSALGAGLATGGAYFAGHEAGKSCRREADGDDFGFCGVNGAGAGFLTVLLAGPTLTTLGSYLPHHALEGQGRWWKGFLGSLLGLGVGFGGVLAAGTASDSDAAVHASVAVGAVVMATVPVLFLEIDHATRGDRGAARHGPRMAASAAPVPGGMVLGVGGRL
jgi:hypothetical protein